MKGEPSPSVAVMSELTTAPATDLKAFDPSTDAQVKSLCKVLERDFPQANIETEHLFHAGMYARTVWMPAGSVVVGAKIKIDTLLILNGHVRMKTGENWEELAGYCVLSGAAGRRGVVVVLEDTVATMIFPTNAKTVDEAERQFTDEFEELGTRKGKCPDGLPPPQ